MKFLILWELFIKVIVSSPVHVEAVTKSETNQLAVSDIAKDEKEIRALIRKALNWANSGNAIGFLPPAFKNSKGKIYTGFDLVKHKQNLQKLKATTFFSREFVNNYNQIILTLDKKFKNGSYGKWQVGDLPPFPFGSEANPWTLCQDVPYDNPNPFDFLEIKVLKLGGSEGNLSWKWGNLNQNTDPGWRNFNYLFKVVKENNQWKIAYLEGFDLHKSTTKL